MKKRPGSLWPLGLILLLCPFGLRAETSSAGAALDGGRRRGVPGQASCRTRSPGRTSRARSSSSSRTERCSSAKATVSPTSRSARRFPWTTTLFRPGSISKLFTWTAVMQLVEQGKLDLDRDVNTYLDFKVPEAFGKPITLRDIMTHTPGYEDYVKELFVTDPSRIQPLGQHVKTHQPQRIFPPGTTPARTPTTRPRSRATSSSASPGSRSRSTSRRTSPVRSG